MTVRAAAGVQGWVGGSIDAVVSGRLLLAVCGAGVVGFAPLLKPDARTWLTLAVVSAAMTLVLLLSFVVAWTQLPDSATMVFPASICAALAALGGFAAPGFAAPLTGMITLGITYVGLTRRPGTTVLCLPAAAMTLLYCYIDITGAVVVRLLIALFIWTVLGELLARLMRHQHTLSDALSGQAHHDPLTGIANRRDLDTRMLTTNPGDTLVMCDLDHFKRINDTLGHAAGDRILAEFAATLQATLRSSDYCARYGGEEFLLILPRCTSSQARALLARLADQWANLQPTVTFSAGVATCTNDRAPAHTLAAADTALYAAKAAGRNRTITETDQPHTDPAQPATGDASCP